MTGRMFGHQCEAKARLAQTRWNARTNTAEADDQPSRSRHAWTRRVKSLRFTIRALGADRRTLRMLDEHEDWSACKQRYCGDAVMSAQTYDDAIAGISRALGVDEQRAASVYRSPLGDLSPNSGRRDQHLQHLIDTRDRVH